MRLKARNMICKLGRADVQTKHKKTPPKAGFFKNYIKLPHTDRQTAGH